MAHGTLSAHPALPRLRGEAQNRNIVFDVHGVTGLDGAGAQVLLEILQAYRASGSRVFFCRGPRRGGDVWRLLVKSGIVEVCGGEAHFVDSVREALKLAEVEEVEDGDEDGANGGGGERYRDEPASAR